MKARSYKYYRQLDYMDCGPTCLKMIAAHYGKDYSMDFLRANSYITRQGVSMLGISEAAEKIGFKTLMVKLTYDQVINEAPLPCILHWNQEHFVVLYEAGTSWLGLIPFLKTQTQFLVADPGHALIRVDRDTFRKCWISSHDQKGVALLLEPTPHFYEQQEPETQKTQGFRFLLNYLTPYRRYLVQIMLGMLFSSLLAMLFPFLTQGLVDYGIHRHNLDFVHLILLSQLLLFVGSTVIDIIRNWILLHINTRISVTIISHFLIKLMRLPISFFDTKNIGDISQRINDHHRIESFLTGSTLNTLFSLVNLIIFSVVFALYDTSLLVVFLVGSGLSIAWVLLFLKHRKELDYRRFQRLRDNQNSLYELITGMQEIKLHNSERSKRWEWERIQAKLFKINIRGLVLEQYQEIGSTFFTQLKNILISYMAASAVIQNDMTLGMMLSISYIVGQMNGPLSQILQFLRSIQDAKISLERLSEIHNRPDEEIDEELTIGKLSIRRPHDTGPTPVSVYAQSEEAGISLNNVSFRYGGPHSAYVLKDISLHIPKGKVTAIVGSSGSGKTTLLKLLLKFYPPTEGEIRVDGNDLNDVSAKMWRNNCGSVMQDGYVFSDSIARNIAVDGERIDELKLVEAASVAAIHDFVKRLPLGFMTKIGNTGAGLSGGQRQRIFVARAVYKDPKYLFFDEATSALDANNERAIMANLEQFFENRTVLVIAHRLSTVRKADQIIVLDNGMIRERGTHLELVAKRGYYYELVKNQLELAEA
ncbi:peptidase domain-containing ABC transporter [Spirosoma oryzicola]|uniref:peptidase domain-containing ABC transporter n=1 Tax=Spirosoma oryzicola TaxID=2898794 RepID=UPI001E4EEB3E|nr:peptidase domain-containing ABC transporter [Spirosoma oryzicola]UHG94921.1 peptidase domain-containing ABC transporter [Spirosoma oryzicola]